MKRIISMLAISLTAIALLTTLSGCNNTPEGAAADTGAAADGGAKTIDLANTMGAGVSVDYIVTSDEAAWEITGCPAYGDKTTPYAYGKLTKGDSFAYELITIIIVNGNYYGKKPFHDFPNGFIEGDNTFKVQFSSNDGQGTDWNAEKICVFLVPTGYEDEIEPDAASGYSLPPAQVNSLKENSILAVQIDRKINVSE